MYASGVGWLCVLCYLIVLLYLYRYLPDLVLVAVLYTGFKLGTLFVVVVCGLFVILAIWSTCWCGLVCCLCSFISCLYDLFGRFSCVFLLLI